MEEERSFCETGGVCAHVLVFPGNRKLRISVEHVVSEVCVGRWRRCRVPKSGLPEEVVAGRVVDWSFRVILMPGVGGLCEVYGAIKGSGCDLVFIIFTRLGEERGSGLSGYVIVRGTSRMSNEERSAATSPLWRFSSPYSV